MISTTTESSSHQLVGYVTKMFTTFGYINNEIFFPRKCVIGPMVEVGDHVATNAIYQPNMPIKWSAEKVWLIQDSHLRLREKDEVCWAESSKSMSSVSRNEVDVIESYRTVGERHRTHKLGVLERKRQNSSNSPVSQSKTDSDVKRRRVPINAENADIGSASIRILHDVKLFNKKELVVPDFQRHFQKILPPVHLYRVNCHWQDSFPLLKPFQPLKNTVFQAVPSDNTTSEFLVTSPSDGYYVKVLLFSIPSISVLHEKISSRLLDGDDHYRRSLQKYIKVLAFKHSHCAYKAIGGSWDVEKDGKDPSNPKTLINTAVRCCNDQIGLDLSLCTHWHRFMEFRYSRTEGLTARPSSVLFPGTQLWGHAGYSEPEQGKASTGSSNAGGTTTTVYKPFHRIVVYLLPDLTSLVPSDEDWPAVKAKYELQMNCPDKVKQEGEECRQTKRAIDESVTVDSNPRQTASPANFATLSDETGRTAHCAMEEQKSSVASTGTMEEHSVTVVTGTGPGTSPTSVKSDHEDGPTIVKLHGEFDLLSMKVSELREQLKIRNLPAEGVRAQLVSRLKVAVEKEEEEARKAEDERKQREKESQERLAALAKAVPEKTGGIAKLSTDNNPKSSDTGEVGKVTLRNIPSIVVRQLRHMVYYVSLETLMDQKPDQMNSEVYEFMFCIKSFLDMLRRDATFILFRALVSAADRGVQAKPSQRSGTGSESSAKSWSSDHQKKRTVREAASAGSARARIVDIPLLYACSLFDTNNRGYLSLADVEDLIFSLALPVSRYQVRSLLAKVCYHQRIHYRTLTDADHANKAATGGRPPTALYSDIDDDEYLLELVRGGDAILEDQNDEPSVGSILLLRSTDSRGGDTDETSVGEITTLAPEEFVRQLRRSECENVRLMARIQSQAKEIESLSSLSDKVSGLENKLASTSALLDDYRLRARKWRERAQAVNRSLEQQALTLDSCRAAIQQAAERLRTGQRSSEEPSQSPSRRATSREASRGRPEPGHTEGGSAGDAETGEGTGISTGSKPTGVCGQVQGSSDQLCEGTKNEMEVDTNATEFIDSAPPLLETEFSVTGSVGCTTGQDTTASTSGSLAVGGGRYSPGQTECGDKNAVDS